MYYILIIYNIYLNLNPRHKLNHHLHQDMIWHQLLLLVKFYVVYTVLRGKKKINSFCLMTCIY